MRRPEYAGRVWLGVGVRWLAAHAIDLRVPRAIALADDREIPLTIEELALSPGGQLERTNERHAPHDQVGGLPPTDQWWTAEYLAQSLSTGDWLYLMGLGDLGGDASHQHYFVFHGPQIDVRQRELTSFARTRDGRTMFSYTVGGDLVQVEFPGSCEASRVSRLCPGTMNLAGEESDLESRWDDFPRALADLSFHCQYTIDPLTTR